MEILSQALKIRKECGNTDHIVRLDDVFAHHNCMYLVLEYMDWGSLDTLILHHKALGAPSIDQGAVAAIVGSVLRGLDHLHTALRATHGDLAPRNIALSASGAVKLTDAGRIPAAEPGNCAMFLQTSAYKAPEQVPPAPASVSSTRRTARPRPPHPSPKPGPPPLPR